MRFVDFGRGSSPAFKFSISACVYRRSAKASGSRLKRYFMHSSARMSTWFHDMFVHSSGLRRAQVVATHKGRENRLSFNF